MSDIPPLEKGKGGFGAVYEVQETIQLKKYAVKTELISSDSESFEACLPWEETILLELQKLPEKRHNRHFIKVVDRGILPPLRFMLMTLVGKSLKDLLLNEKNLCFSQNCCWKIAFQTLEALEAFHLAGFVHRDIKPHNYTIGRYQKSDTIFMIDFGLVRCYTGKKYPSATLDTQGFAGTLKYCSRSAHKGIYQYPKDDLESWIMTIMDLHHPEALFWSREANETIFASMKTNLFIGVEPNHIFNEKIPPEYKQLVKIIGDLTPLKKLEDPDDEMKKKMDFTPMYKVLIDIKKLHNFSVNKPFIWEEKHLAKNFRESPNPSPVTIELNLKKKKKRTRQTDKAK